MSWLWSPKTYLLVATVTEVVNIGPWSSCQHPLPLAEAASMCGKTVECGNMINGTQELPVLEGVTNYVKDDGTCSYGHAGKDGECKTGMDCGVTKVVCTCVSRERAQESLTFAKMIRQVVGVVCMVAGLLIVCSFVWKRVVPDSWKRLPQLQIGRGGRVSPWGSCDPQTIGAPHGQFVGIVAGPTTAAANAQRHQAQRATGPAALGPIVVAAKDDSDTRCGIKRGDWMTFLLVAILPTGCFAAGITFFVFGMNIKTELYYNECKVKA
eukprot:TRINITY_DN4953_c2_g1_i1.p1 TRINITY_DN4953_c2_g1~~TRINITY_DN4953_c2_g1_i1.p1  ORF type:complete len:278 (-),score=40.30 TRINITY_DN4953_c2_g1_i1:60-860(-)